MFEREARENHFYHSLERITRTQQNHTPTPQVRSAKSKHLQKRVMKSFSVQLSPPRQNVSTTDSVASSVRARSTRVSGGAGQWVKFRRF